MIKMVNKFVWMTIALILCGHCSAVFAELPKGLMIVGYDGSGWFSYISQPKTNDWLKLTDVQDPAYMTWLAEIDQFVIKSNDGKLYQYQFDTKELKHLESFDNAYYTQLRSYNDGFMMVELLKGKSRDTHIVSIDTEYKRKVVVRQVSAQFHPYRHNDQLYYAHVSCRLECKPLIQEVWRKDLVTGQTKQLTLLNATSYLFSVDPEGKYGFISSNQKGYYHLARLDLSSGKLTWLTAGKVTDSFPSIAQDGSLYFVRRIPSGSQLMRLRKESLLQQTVTPENSLEMIPLPEGVKKIRYLELNNQ
ncbi:MAG: hypothetical protein ABW168_21670 [Sedimenticola sp.]